MKTALTVKFKSRFNGSRIWYVVFDLGDLNDNIKASLEYAWKYSAFIEGHA